MYPAIVYEIQGQQMDQTRHDPDFQETRPSLIER